MTVVTKRLYRLFYARLGRTCPLLRRLFHRAVDSTVELGRAVINLAAAGGGSRVPEMPAISEAARRADPPAP
jgi:hypothetical protein